MVYSWQAGIKVTISSALPWNNQNHISWAGALHFHPEVYFLVSNLCDIFAAVITGYGYVLLANFKFLSWLNLIVYHGMTIANSWKQLLEEESSLLIRTNKSIYNQQNDTHLNIRYLRLWWILSTSFSLNLPELQILSNSSPPAAYSIIMAKCVGVSATWKIKWPFLSFTSWMW
jgi:hypothetical protein